MDIFVVIVEFCLGGKTTEIICLFPRSTFRAKYITETALLKVVSDNCLATDQNHAVILVLLDLSDAFDTVDYDILVGRLTSRLGIRGVVLHWLNSYLRSRTQTFIIVDAMSVQRIHAQLRRRHNFLLLLTIKIDLA